MTPFAKQITTSSSTVSVFYMFIVITQLSHCHCSSALVQPTGLEWGGVGCWIVTHKNDKSAVLLHVSVLGRGKHDFWKEVPGSKSSGNFRWKFCFCSTTERTLWRHACVPDDVVKDYETLKLQLELTVGVFRQRLCFKPPQPEIGIFVSIDKELEGANLREMKHNRCSTCLFFLTS